MRKPTICICENADQHCSNCTAVFATDIVHVQLLFFFFINIKFQVSSYLLFLYSLLCVVPGRKSRKPFSFFFFFLFFFASRLILFRCTCWTILNQFVLKDMFNSGSTLSLRNAAVRSLHLIIKLGELKHAPM